MSQNITHEGIVVGVDGQRVTVQFVRNSACSGCHAKALCSGGTSEAESRTVVANSYGIAYQVGEPVKIIVANGLAWSAVVIAFIVPLILAMICLFVVIGLTGSESAGCLSTLALFALYFLGVWLMRSKLDRKVEFTIERTLTI